MADNNNIPKPTDNDKSKIIRSTKPQSIGNKSPVGTGDGSETFDVNVSGADNSSDGVNTPPDDATPDSINPL